MSEKEKLALLEETLEADEGSLSAEMGLDEVESYDSLARLSIVVMMEDHFHKKVSANDIRAFQTVGDILRFMEK